MLEYKLQNKQKQDLVKKKCGKIKVVKLSLCIYSDQCKIKVFKLSYVFTVTSVEACLWIIFQCNIFLHINIDLSTQHKNL